MSKYTAVYTGNVVGIYKDGEQMTIEQIVSDLNTKAVEPVQRCNCCGYLVTDSEHKGCLRAAKQEPAQVVPVGYCLMPREPTQWMREQIACGIESNSVADVWGRLIRAVDIENKHRAKEPAQAVPFAWVLECMTSIGTTCWMLSWNRSGVGSCNRLHGQDHEKPLYTAPPAIDDETKRMALGCLVNGGV